MLFRKLKFYPAIIWSVILAILMLTPQDKFPESKLLSYDKIAHVGVYAILSILILLGFFFTERLKKNLLKKHILTASFTIIYGGILEWGQNYIPGRMTDTYDLIANSVGGVLGVILFITFMKQKLVNSKLIL